MTKTIAAALTGLAMLASSAMAAGTDQTGFGLTFNEWEGCGLISLALMTPRNMDRGGPEPWVCVKLQETARWDWNKCFAGGLLTYVRSHRPGEEVPNHVKSLLMQGCGMLMDNLDRSRVKAAADAALKPKPLPNTCTRQQADGSWKDCSEEKKPIDIQRIPFGTPPAVCLEADGLGGVKRC